MELMVAERVREDVGYPLTKGSTLKGIAVALASAGNHDAMVTGVCSCWLPGATAETSWKPRSASRILLKTETLR